MQKATLLLALVIGLGTPASAADGPKFALDPASPATGGSGIGPADVLTSGPASFQSGSTLGLNRRADFLNDVSYGGDAPGSLLSFTVGRATVGLAGTAVYLDALAGNAASNVYQANLSGGNARELSGTSLGLTPGLFGDALSALATGSPTPFTYFALNPNSALVNAGGANASDILASRGAGTFSVFANGLSLMGLNAGDQIEGLTVLDTRHDGVARPGDLALFTLSPFSPSTFTGSSSTYIPGIKGNLSPADVLMTDFTGRFTLFAAAGRLGLDPGDEVTGLQTGSVVPEPGSLLLLGLGLGVCGLSRLRLGGVPRRGPSPSRTGP